MKQRLQNLCDSRVTALIILQIVPLIPTLITVCANFSVAALIAFLIAIAIALWLISGLVKVQKGALEAGANTIRRFMKFEYVLMWILVVILALETLLGLAVIGETDQPLYPILLIVSLLAFMVYTLTAVRALKNTARLAHDIASGAEYVDRQGKLPEISCLISIVLPLLSLLLPAVFKTTFHPELEKQMTFSGITFTSLLNTALTIIRAIISYSLLCDFRKAVNE